MPIVKARKSSRRADPAEAIDGRALRSVRSQQAILDALLALMKEGERSITMDLVAARAGVGVRTLFRHFQGTSALVAALRERIGSEAVQLALHWSQVGTLHGDLDALLAARVRMFVWVEPLRRLAQTVRLPDPEHRARLAGLRRRLRADLRKLVRGYVPAVAADDLEALDAWLSGDVWERLRNGQGLSEARALRVMQRTANTLARALVRRANEPR